MRNHRIQVTTVFSAAIASRVATVALMVLANALLPTHDATGVHKFRPRSFPVPSRPATADSGGGGGGGGDGGIFSAFTRWDAAWFLSIADAGYPGGRSSADLDDHAHEKAVDCAGTGRAWGGEDYHEYALEVGKDYKLEEESHEEEEQEQEYRSPPQRRRCRADIPLEEQAHAFFPLYPWLVRWGAAALRAGLARAGLDLGGVDSLVLAAVLVSNLSFVVAAVLLYQLAAVVTNDALLAFRGALAFCATPASVFFSTAYTESLYAALSFAGLLVLFAEGRRRRSRRRGKGSGASNRDAAAHLSNSSSKTLSSSSSWKKSGTAWWWWWWWSGALNAWIAAAFLSLATLTRSNGIAGAGVLVLEKLRWMADDAEVFASSGTTYSPIGSTSIEKRTQDGGGDGGGGDGGSGSGGEAERREPRPSTHPWLRLVACAVATVLQALLVVAPYILVQVYAYRKFCGAARAGALLWEGDSNRHFGVDGGVDDLAAELHPWCAWRVPSVYSYVQSTYWGVGALKYYEWKQIPNFLLAAPTLALTVFGTARFFSAQVQGSAVSGLTVGDEQEAEGSAGCRWVSCRAWPWRLMEAFLGPPRLPGPASPPFERSGASSLVVQWAFLGVFCALCMNVQVATRFLAAACPPLHWWTAGLLVRAGETDAGNAARSRAVGTGLLWYLALYFVVGTILHANFLPWT